MRPSIRRLLVLAAFATWATGDVAVAAGPELGSLRTRFPTASIDTVERADAALAATNGAKIQVDKEYKAEARACASTFLVNDCTARARELQRKRLAEIDGVELEANRFKRKDRSGRLDADRARREAEREANRKNDEAQRARSRGAFDERQAGAARDDAERGRRDAARAGVVKTRKPTTKPTTPASDGRDAAQRAKNASSYTAKVAEGETHRAEIARRLQAKEADRQRRAQAKAAKEAAARPVATAAPSAP